MTGSWRVEVAPAAEAVLRELSRPAARRIAAVLDDIATRGPAGLHDLTPGDQWFGTADREGYRLLVAGTTSGRNAVLVSIEHAEVPHRLALLPVSPLVRLGLNRWLAGLGMDLRYTFRALRRGPGFAAIVALTLAIGVGGATAVLHVVRTTYRSALPFVDSERLVRIRNESRSAGEEPRRYNLSPADFRLIQRHGRGYEWVAAALGRSLSLLGDGPAERVAAIGVSAGWLAGLGIRPVLGRAFTEAEEEAGRDAAVALIAHSLWQRRFGGDSAVLGRDLSFDGGSVRIVGVLPRHFHYPYDVEVWMPWTFEQTATSLSSLNVIAKLAPGTGLDAVGQDGARVHQARVTEGLTTSASGFNVASFRADFIRDDARMLHALGAAVVFLLILTCLNVANLLIGRFATRRSEIGVRAALGAGRARQLRQLVLETLILFGGGGLAGTLAAVGVARYLDTLIPAVFRTQFGLGRGIAPTTILIGLGICLGAGLAVGAVVAFRSASSDVAAVIKEAALRTTGSRTDRRFLDGLVVLQLALSLVLLVGATVLIEHFRTLSRLDPGYRLDGITTMRLTIEQTRYQDTASRVALVGTVEAAVRRVPGVADVGITTVNPLCCGDWRAAIEIEGQPIAPNTAPMLVAHSLITPNWTRTLGIPILRGTGYPENDRPGGDPTVVVDEEFARIAWPGQDPIGKRVRAYRPGQPWRTVIGVVPVITHEAEMRAAWYPPYLQDPLGPSGENLHVMVRGSGESVDVDGIRRSLATVDPTLAVYDVQSLVSHFTETMAQDRLGAVVSTTFAMFGLLLAGLSLFGLLAFAVEARRAELGTRLALGAGRGLLLTMILGQAARRVGIGIGVGLVVAAGFNQVLRIMVEGAGWIAWPALVTVVALLTLIAIAAAVVPAVRATRVDPAQCLRP